MARRGRHLAGCPHPGAGEQPCGGLPLIRTSLSRWCNALASLRARDVRGCLNYCACSLSGPPAGRHEGLSKVSDRPRTLSALEKKTPRRTEMPSPGMVKLGAGAEAWNRIGCKWKSSDLDRCHSAGPSFAYLESIIPFASPSVSCSLLSLLLSIISRSSNKLSPSLSGTTYLRRRRC